MKRSKPMYDLTTITLEDDVPAPPINGRGRPAGALRGTLMKMVSGQSFVITLPDERSAHSFKSHCTVIAKRLRTKTGSPMHVVTRTTGKNGSGISVRVWRIDDTATVQV